MDRAKRKQSWAELGAQAISLLTQGEVTSYVCPMCQRAVEDHNELTFEHAPPRALGGREVALTCKNCNNTSGHSLDAQMRRAEDMLDWNLGTSKKPLRARLAPLGGPAVNVETERRDGGAVRFVGLPDQNDPNVTTANLAALDAMVERPSHEQGFTVSFPEQRFVAMHAQAGWLRSAYLAAFAWFGYRYALRRLFDPVRAHIADPGESPLERYYLLGRTVPANRHALISVATPRSMRSVIVRMGRHLIFLPGFHADSDKLYERLAERVIWPPPSRSLRLRGQVFPWPTRPAFGLDLSHHG